MEIFIQLIKNVLGFDLIKDDILSIYLGIEYWTLNKVTFTLTTKLGVLPT